MVHLLTYTYLHRFTEMEVACLDAKHLWDFTYLWNVGGGRRWEWIFCFKDFQIPAYLSWTTSCSCFLVCHSFSQSSAFNVYRMALGEKKGRLLGVAFILKCIHVPFFVFLVFQDLISLSMFLMEIPSSKLNTTKAIILNVKTCKTVHTALTHQETLKCSVCSIISWLY